MFSKQDYKLRTHFKPERNQSKLAVHACTLKLRYIEFLPGWFWADIESLVHVPLPKWPINQFQPVQQSRQQSHGEKIILMPMDRMHINVYNISSNQILLVFVTSIFCFINSKLLQNSSKN